MAISQVMIICNAYESGYGHGYRNDGLPNPHPEGSDEREAYDIGYNAGWQERFSEQAEIGSLHNNPVESNRKKPCSSTCAHHVTHPCEKCGQQWD